MYKVSYYLTGTSRVLFRMFETLGEATKFSNSLPINSVLEIKLYTESPKKEDRT